MTPGRGPKGSLGGAASALGTLLMGLKKIGTLESGGQRWPPEMGFKGPERSWFRRGMYYSKAVRMRLRWSLGGSEVVGSGEVKSATADGFRIIG